jgi:hypothetical protein
MRRLIAAYRAQTALWERYFAAQRPWERDAGMRWIWTPRGWRLRGWVLPAHRPQCGRVDQDR